MISISVNAVETYTASINRGAAVLEQLAYGKASNSEVSDRFGVSVSLSGDTMAVGAIREASNTTSVGGDQADNSNANSGAVYILE